MGKTKKIHFPGQIGNVPGFVSNVDDKLQAGLAAKYGLTPDESTKSLNFKTNIPLKVTEAATAQATAQAKAESRDNMIYEAKVFYNEMGHKWQKHANYDTQDMEDTGFFKIETPPDPNTAKPVISKTTVLPDQVILDWIRAGWSGVYIESIVEGGDTQPAMSVSAPPDPSSPLWVKLGEDDRSPYEDTRTNITNRPEVRYYRMRYKQNNKPIGLYSDIVKVIVEIY